MLGNYHKIYYFSKFSGIFHKEKVWILIAGNAFYHSFIGPITNFPFENTIFTRSCQKFSKQICLWDLAQSIGILFIIQIVGAI